MMTKPCLELKQVSKSFGGLMALMNVSVNVSPSQIKSIIGPNGSGKTTLFNIITGFISASCGSITYRGISLVKKKPHQVAMLGITRTFQATRIFGNMTVLENVMVGRHLRTRSEIVGAALSWPPSLREERETRIRAEEIVRLMGLDSKKEGLAENLSFGERRLLEIGRCLASGPEMILMDEPAAGLNDMEKEGLAELILKIRAWGITVLLVEHNMNLVMHISDEVSVLNHGEKIAEGTPAEIRTNEAVINAYLGRRSSKCLRFNR